MTIQFLDNNSIRLRDPSIWSAIIVAITAVLA